jgi:putative oxidoreductase
MGIVLVHAQNGWFVVGPSTGGVEYSILLLLALIVIASREGKK